MRAEGVVSFGSQMVPSQTGILAVRSDDFSIKKETVKYKAIITDLDGTAVNSPIEKRATKRLATAVAALDNLGVKVCAATGRAPTFAKPMLESMNLQDPAIVSGGTKIIDPKSGDDLWVCGLSKDQVSMIKQRLKGLSYGFLWNDSTEEDYLSGGWSLEALDEIEDVYFFEVCFVPAAELESVKSLLAGVEGVAVTVVVAQKPETHDLHITNSQATKEHAVYELEKIIGVDRSEMIGVGDGHNDLHLYNAVGYKVAMANAVPELKNAADKIIGDVVQDGLAEYFEELVRELKNEKVV